MGKALLFCAVLSLHALCFAKELSVLTIGNSFTWSLRSYFSKVVESAGDSLYIEYANFGGCTLERHWNYISEEEAKPNLKNYSNKTEKLRDILKRRHWDIVTIQQGSHESWNESSYMPFAKNIVDYVRKFAPDSKIMIQQTWSYRADAPRLAKWNFDNSEMYKRLNVAYRNVAAQLGLEIIPTGAAVQSARAKSDVKFINYKSLADFKYPDLPRQAGDVVGSLKWRKVKGKMLISSDTIHLNSYGEYLQACVWYARLYKCSAQSAVKYCPDNMGDSQAQAYRKIADEVVDAERKLDAAKHK